MNLGVPTERAVGEQRVALVPPVAESLVDDGHDVSVAAGAGEGAGWADEDYEAVGCTVLDDREAVFDRADVLFQVQALGAAPDTETDPTGTDRSSSGCSDRTISPTSNYRRWPTGT
ncbi:hypothetical protein [Halapricum sp. CBA1109]|uniref:hypothetical protein n=1 Tax=Halapricum sp. CBA1109 TaxID=2668068 RepID=UPI00351AC47A